MVIETDYSVSLRGEGVCYFPFWVFVEVDDCVGCVVYFCFYLGCFFVFVDFLDFVGFYVIYGDVDDGF